jgi:hypothetical protein
MQLPIDDEQMIPLTDVPDLLWMPRPRGRKIHVSTIVRWATRGRQGIRLATLKVGSRLCTTRSALLAFFRAKNTASVGLGCDTPTPRQRQRQINRAAAEAAEILGTNFKSGGAA